jgi:hypothetical protein
MTPTPISPLESVKKPAYPGSEKSKIYASSVPFAHLDYFFKLNFVFSINQLLWAN